MQGTTCSKPINNCLLVHHGWSAGSYSRENRILVSLVGQGSVKLDLILDRFLGILGVKRHLAVCSRQLATNEKLGSNKELFDWPAEADLQAKRLPRQSSPSSP